jgi:hypothetical protein
MLMATHDAIGTTRTAINLQRTVDSNFRIQNGIGPRKRDPRTHSGGVQKDNPFPTTWIFCWDHLELNSFVAHCRSRKVPANAGKHFNSLGGTSVHEDHQFFPETRVLGRRLPKAEFAANLISPTGVRRRH